METRYRVGRHRYDSGEQCNTSVRHSMAAAASRSMATGTLSTSPTSSIAATTPLAVPRSSADGLGDRAAHGLGPTHPCDAPRRTSSPRRFDPRPVGATGDEARLEHATTPPLFAFRTAVSRSRFHSISSMIAAPGRRPAPWMESLRSERGMVPVRQSGSRSTADSGARGPPPRRAGGPRQPCPSERRDDDGRHVRVDAEPGEPAQLAALGRRLVGVEG